MKELKNSNMLKSKDKQFFFLQLVKMLAIVVAVFSLCWFPLETYLLLNEIQPQINE